MEETKEKRAYTKSSPARPTLESLFNDLCAIDVDRTLMHQAFQIPGAGTESTMSSQRTSGLKLRYHPGYGLIGFLRGKYFFSPSANVIVGHE